MRYLIIHSRWIRNGSQNGEHIVAESTRKKEANGLARHNFNSHMEMLLKHEIEFEDYDIDEQEHSITLADAEGLWYHSRFYVREIEG